MATTEQLLKLSPRGAIVRMINDRNLTFFDGSPRGPLVISEPLDVGGVRTEVEISVRRRLSGHDGLPFAGQLAFRFNRLDVEGSLSGKLTGYRPPMPTSTQVLLNELTRRTGIQFDVDDFVLEDIIRNNAAPYFLKAKVESLRWVGQMEVYLVDLVDLMTYVPGGLPTGTATLSFATPPTNTKDNQPYLNATAFRAELDDVIMNNPVTTMTDPLASFVSKVVPSLGMFIRDESSPWVISIANANYNLYGAQLISKDENLLGLNPLVPAANKVARVRLGAKDIVYNSKDLLIPYAEPTLIASAFNDVPRLKKVAVVNSSNGTPWNIWLNSLVAPSVITALPDNLNLRFSGPDLWTADANAPSPTNLHNAVVQYNGPRRAYDLPPFFGESNRIIVVTMSESNTAYQGNVTYHYRAPIMINEVVPDAILGSPFDFDLAPSEGVSPYTFTLVSGALGPTHVLNAAHHIVGPTDGVGRFTVVYDVTDDTGVKVRYSLSYRAVVADVVIADTPPAATLDVPYEFTFTVSGGVPGYTYSLTDLSGSSGVTLSSPFAPTIAGTFTGTTGTRSFVLEVTDNQGTVTTRTFTIVVN